MFFYVMSDKQKHIIIVDRIAQTGCSKQEKRDTSENSFPIAVGNEQPPHGLILCPFHVLLLPFRSLNHGCCKDLQEKKYEEQLLQSSCWGYASFDRYT